MAGEWNRLTRHAKRSVIESQDLAASLAGSSVQPEHLLLTLLDDSTSAAAVLFTLAGFPADEVRVILEERVAVDSQFENPVEKPAFSPALRRVVEDAGALAGPGSVGSEHLTLAILAAASPLGIAIKEACRIDSTTLTPYLEMLEGHELKGRASTGAQQGAEKLAQGSAAGSAAARMGGTPPPRPTPAPATELKVPVTKLAREAAPSPEYAARQQTSAPTGVGSHTLLALARLVIDLAGKAASVARAHGSPSVADQLDRMRGEVQSQMGLSKSSAGGESKEPVADVKSA